MASEPIVPPDSSSPAGAVVKRPRGRPRRDGLPAGSVPKPAVLPPTPERLALIEKIRTTPSGSSHELEALKADPGTPARVFEILTSERADWPKMSLTAVARQLGMPKGAFIEWFTTEHAGVYDAALKVVAADLAVKAMQAALDATPEDVAVAKLQAETALKIAARFDRARYGDQSVSVKNAVIVADAGLLGTASELLERLAGPRVEKEVRDDAG